MKLFHTGMLLATVSGLILSGLLGLGWQDGETKPRIPQDPIPVPREGEIERRDFMRTKLLYTQNIFEGLTLGDFGLIEHGINELQEILEAEQWVTIDNDEYRKLVDEFKVAAERLNDTAESKNVEATALRFYEMSTRCIDCHRHLKLAGYVSFDQPD